MELYGRIRWPAVWNETRRFWSVLQTWKHFAAPLLGFILGIIQAIWRGQNAVFHAVLIALLWAVCFYVVAWAGTFLINYVWLTPAALYREHATALEASHRETQSINASVEALRADLVAERDKDKHPEITVVANFRYIGPGDTGDFAVACEALLCNIRPARTNLRRIVIDASDVQRTLVFSNCSARDVLLEQGISKQIEVRATLILDTAAGPHDTVEIDLSALKVSAVDGFGNQHALKIEPGTMLFLDPDKPFALIEIW